MNRCARRVRVLTKLGVSILHAKLLRQRRPIFVGFYITNTCDLRSDYCFANVEGRFDDPARVGFSAEEAIRSVDGLEAATNAMRGKGAFKRALRGIEMAVSRGMTVRIHAVLSKPSLGDMEALAQIARDLGAGISLSPPNYLSDADYLGSGQDPNLQLTREEYQEFYRRCRKLKLAGYPINNSMYSIEKSLEWPIEYHKFIENGQTFTDYEPIRCVISDLHGCIDAEGTMFNCIQLGCLNGPSIRKHGVRGAWELLPQWRPNCESRSSVNTIEVATYLHLRREVVPQGLRFFFGPRAKTNGRYA